MTTPFEDRIAGLHWPFQMESGSRAAEPGIPPETWARRGLRWGLACAYGMKPHRLRTAPTLASMLARHYLTPKARRGLPDANSAQPGQGLCGIVTDTSVETLIAGFRAGLFPMGHVSPMKWWSPAERAVLPLNELHIEKNLRRRIRNNHFTVTFDKDPLGVLIGCSEPRPGRPPLTWITPRMIEAALGLFAAGHLHTVEVWNAKGDLVGGLYGVAAGPVFSIESQFHRERDTSKVATAVLIAHLAHWGFHAADGKHETAHLKSLGFRNVPRGTFLEWLAGPEPQLARPGRWHIEERLDIGNWDPARGTPPAFKA